MTPLLPIRPAGVARRGSNKAEKPLPKTLRELRHERGKTLAQISAATGLHRARLSELERGERSPKSTELGLLATAFGVRGWRVLHSIVVDERES